jgi:dihydrofolate reductase
MRTLAITENITVDGSIEMLEDWFDPKRQGDTDQGDLLEEEQRQGSEADALLVGRRTFEAFREHWPKQTDDTTGIAEYLNRAQKYVVSSTLTDPQWESSTVLSSDPVEQVTALKQEEGKEAMRRRPNGAAAHEHGNFRTAIEVRSLVARLVSAGMALRMCKAAATTT